MLNFRWYLSFIITYIISLVINIFYHLRIDFSSKIKGKIKKDLEKLYQCNTEKELTAWYKGHYEKYTSDTRDWYPSLYTMLYRETDDCDGMAVLGQAILKRLSVAKFSGNKCVVGVYSFRSLTNFKNGHAMALLNNISTGELILFDYGQFMHFTHVDGIKLYFNKTYNKINNSQVNIYRIWNVPGPIFTR